VASRARGDSSDTAPYAAEREIEDLAALVDNLGEPKPLQAQVDGRPGQRVPPAKGGSR